MVFPQRERPYNTIMHYATPHINFWRVWLMLVSFIWPFVTQDAKIVPVYMTIHSEDGLVCVLHSP